MHKFSDKFIENLSTEAYYRVALESQVECNPRYKTLFYGLKKNHPRNVAVAYPIMFLLRRILYAAVILFTLKVPFLGVITLMLACLGVLAFVLSETQWEDSIINQQHIVNEIALYIVLCHVVIFCGLTPTAASASIVGWSTIGVLLTTIIYNIAVILYCSIRYLKLGSLRLYRRRDLIKA